jgi:hypothetical protein
MRDEKRFFRELKREIKRLGNRKRRRYLQNVENQADDFDFGRGCSEVMNKKPQRVSKARGRLERLLQPTPGIINGIANCE